VTGDDLTPGDPLGAPSSAPPPRAADYGSGPVPPGAFVPRERHEVEDPFAAAPPAEWWRRAVAAVIDAIVIGVMAAFVLGLALLPLNLDDTGGVIGAVIVASIAILAVSIGALVYAPLVMTRTNGRTFGKMATGCRVVRNDGRPMDFGFAALREVAVKAIALGVAASLTGGIAYLVDVFWPFFDGRKRALHDIVVDSRVVRD
jgi:uncharacterized RDD family membrane protein YckC